MVSKRDKRNYNRGFKDGQKPSEELLNKTRIEGFGAGYNKGFSEGRAAQRMIDMSSLEDLGRIY